MSLNDTTFHVIAQTSTPIHQKNTSQCSSLPIVLLLRDTFSKPVVSIFKMSTSTSQLPPSIFISTIKAQVNIIFHLDCYSNPLIHSISKIS